MAAEEEAKANTQVERSARRGSQSNPENPPDEVRYSVDELKENSRQLLDCSPHAVAGALSDTEQKTFTLKDAESRVNKFASREEAKS